MINNSYPEKEYFATLKLADSTVEVSKVTPDFPGEAAISKVCMEHLAELQTRMLGEFLVSGCNYEVAESEKAMDFGFSCDGPAGVMRRCRLEISQYGVDGNVVQRGS